MGKLILDAELRRKVNDWERPVDVYDESGNVVGHYLPHTDYLRLLYDQAKSAVTDDELAKARADVRANGGLTTPEVLERLRQLDERLRGGR